MITTLINNLAVGFDAGNDVVLECPFSFLDSLDTTYAYLGQAAANIDDDTCLEHRVIVAKKNDEEGITRYCKDLSPYIILDKMLNECSGNVSVNFNGHASLQKVLCCLRLGNLVYECACPEQNHKDVFPVQVQWYDPDAHKDLDKYDKNSTRQELFNNMISQFSGQFDIFRDKYPLNGTVKDYMDVLCSHLWEVLGNCEHARNSGKDGNLGFAGFLVHRNGKMVCNLSIITIGQTIQESERSKLGHDPQLAFGTDDTQVDFSSASHLLGVLGRKGGLGRLYKTTDSLSSNLELAIATGDICFIHKEANTNKKTYHLNRRNIPGTIISSRFEVDL